MAIAQSGSRRPVTERDRRGAREPMTVHRVAPGVFEVYSGETSVHTVDVDGEACTCEDFQYRSAHIDRCKHVARVFQTLGKLPIPDGVRVDPTLPKQRARWA